MTTDGVLPASTTGRVPSSPRCGVSLPQSAVDPGEVELRAGRSSTDTEITLGYTLTGQRREVGFDRVLHPEIMLMPAD